MESPKVTVRPGTDGAAVVVCTGEFDLDTAGRVAEACRTRAADAELLLLDVSGVAFADSSFLNELIRLRNARPTALVGPLPKQLLRLLEMTGALTLFDIRDGTGSA
ncbi:STAS domain-containing protein [Streptomyces sp. NBC_01276]|uniref:STAS domain-containing protein n=1 Tax=Streptomyces sp. NBC_01276 TaxID=2903808 RepID=UPI00352C1C22